ncbi:uncharacterized protein EV420DRAFT_1641090 [Desarmillaria tabescens]|uniref:Uncharacterized protein n=1 Tax=Armillaria tabescens TaxID=1929756 RepID=A0AA39N7N2_ARMTA|nr:uncharacterized protein EV420DRAFT_1641090 [Desarmillaria tabescens]KAK0460540.1 hypothetical protein EV420DRAFT_1641090 [Desarmillaria tabescens]
MVMRASDYGTTCFQRTIRRVSFKSDALQNICRRPSMHNAAFGLKASHKELITRSSFLSSTMDVRPLHASLAYHRQCTLVHSQRSSRTRCYRASHSVRSGLEQAVRSDFILIERIDGVALEERWFNTFNEDIGAVIREMLFFDLGLHQRPFLQNGSLFFKKSVSPELQSWLYARERDSEEPAAERYRIGPVVDKQYWFNEPDHAWTDMASYIQVTCRLALGPPTSRNSVSCCSNVYRWRIVLPEHGLAVPYLIHSDLSRSNVIVKPSRAANVVSYIDWQGAVALPYFQSIRLPKAILFKGKVIPIPDEPFSPSEIPSDLPPKLEKQADLEWRLANRQRKMPKVLLQRHPLRLQAACLLQGDLLTSLPDVALRSYADGP